MNNDCTYFYTEQAELARLEGEQLQSRYTKIALFRLAYFIVWIALLILAFQWQLWVAIILFYVGLLGFSRLMRYHDRISKELKIRNRTQSICENELKILEHNFFDRASGEEFADDKHPYSNDMDVFSEGGLFAFYSRCNTSLGKERLAHYFTKQATKATVLKRQEACLELEKYPNWSIRFQAEGFDISDNKMHIRTIQEWLQAEDSIYGRKGLKWVSILLPFLTIGLFIGLWYYLSFTISLIALLPAAYLLIKEKSRVDALQKYVNQSSEILNAYSDMIQHIEGSKFDAVLLKDCIEAIQSEPSASTSIKKLSSYIDNLNVRYNVFGVVLNIFTLWDFHWAWRLEAWRNQHKNSLPKWFDALAEIESLQSISTVGFQHSDWAIPVLQDQHIKGEDIGHPLINPNSRVCNDFESPTKEHIYLVTGSNMGGKSTFLRTVGIQILTSFTGSRVCAKSWSMPEDVRLYSSMRTQDALQESTSGFYAELKRLERLIDRVQDGEPVFYLLDEILKGTNSVDRNKGAAALIRQLLQYPSAGLISTHDLTLGKLEDELNGRLKNICFEVAVDGEELTFDYTLKKGVSQSFNATQLMRQIGIKV